MNDERWTIVDRLLGAALEREPHERAAYLREACGDDEALRREVESLVAHASNGKGVVSTPAVSLADEIQSTGAPMTGRHVGPYVIAARLGAGGMGEVYRARDMKLGRDVAIKILPRIFTIDPDRHARMDREARLLAALNHPHIGAIYGLEELDGTPALVLELVEGDTLAERIAKGPLPITEALTIARQMADALDAAHEKGIVHRDLKPANIKITPNGIVKVLDFGLAKAASGDASGPNLTQSPTVTIGGTHDGVILGTAPYMSPEQARGKAIDKRTDVWAFACVLYEMLTGRVAFVGDTLSDTIAAILEREPEWPALPAATPAPIRRLLRRCLDKDARRRLRDIGDVRAEIDDVLSGAARVPSETVMPASSKRRWWPLAASLTVALIAVTAWAIDRFSHAPEGVYQPPEGPYEHKLEVPRNGQLLLGTAPPVGGIALSPDGATVAMVAAVGGETTPRIWLTPVDGSPARPLAGTEGASYPFWSSDSRFLGFFARTFLWQVDVTAGTPSPTRLAAALSGLALGGAWLEDGTILVGMLRSGLHRLDAGSLQPVTKLADGDAGHTFPSPLPGGAFLYEAQTKSGLIVYAASLEHPNDRTEVVRDSPSALYASGHLIFMVGSTLVAQPFNANTFALSGKPVVLGESWRGQVPLLNASVSQNGILVFDAVGPRNRLTWFTRNGQKLTTAGEPGNYYSPRISHDESSIVVGQIKPSGGADLLTIDDRGVPKSHGPGAGAVWSPQDDFLVLGGRGLQMKAVEGGGTPYQILPADDIVVPTDYSLDGTAILHYQVRNTPDVGVLPMISHKPDKAGNRWWYLDTDANENFSRFSREHTPGFVAYGSAESGRREIYIDSFPVRRKRVTVSTAGGNDPEWGRMNGRRTELFYVAPDSQLMVAQVEFGAGGHAKVLGTPTALFQLPPGEALAGYSPYDVAPVRDQFVVRTPVDANRQLQVIRNWPAKVTGATASR